MFKPVNITKKNFNTVFTLSIKMMKYQKKIKHTIEKCNFDLPLKLVLTFLYKNTLDQKKAFRQSKLLEIGQCKQILNPELKMNIVKF